MVGIYLADFQLEYIFRGCHMFCTNLCFVVSGCCLINADLYSVKHNRTYTFFVSEMHQN